MWAQRPKYSYHCCKRNETGREVLKIWARCTVYVNEPQICIFMRSKQSLKEWKCQTCNIMLTLPASLSSSGLSYSFFWHLTVNMYNNCLQDSKFKTGMRLKAHQTKYFRIHIPFFLQLYSVLTVKRRYALFKFQRFSCQDIVKVIWSVIKISYTWQIMSQWHSNTVSGKCVCIKNPKNLSTPLLLL